MTTTKRRLLALPITALVVAAMAAPAAAAPALANGTLRVNGTDANDRITLRLQAGQPGTIDVDLDDDGSAEFSVERASVTAIVVNAGDGDDIVRFDEGNGAVNVGIPTTIRGGDGGDLLLGGSGAETLTGGNGDDRIVGNRGADVGLMADGDDTFIWNQGDGSDVVEGQGGHDTMVFNGFAAAEQFDLSADGNRLRFFRTQGSITMDTAGVEQVDVNPLGGADTITVNDLGATDVTRVNVDLAGTLGGTAGDGPTDRVIVNGTNGDDTIVVSGNSGGVTVGGLAATIGVFHPDSASDRLEINTLTGIDTVDFGGLVAGAIQLFIDGVLVP